MSGQLTATSCPGALPRLRGRRSGPPWKCPAYLPRLRQESRQVLVDRPSLARPIQRAPVRPRSRSKKSDHGKRIQSLHLPDDLALLTTELTVPTVGLALVLHSFSDGGSEAALHGEGGSIRGCYSRPSRSVFRKSPTGSARSRQQLGRPVRILWIDIGLS
jgi:hypothetical protein